MPDHSRTVLVVDDDALLVDRFRSWLDDDYEVLTALDGETALGAADEADVLAEYARLAAKRAAIESSQPMDELVVDPEYDELCRRCESTRRELDGIVQGFEAADFETAFRAPECNAN